MIVLPGPGLGSQWMRALGKELATGLVTDLARAPESSLALVALELPWPIRPRRDCLRQGP